MPSIDSRFFQIRDITSLLPLLLQDALEAKGEIIEALVVSRQPDHAPFAGVALETDHDNSVERLQVASGASSEWLNRSHIVQDLLSSAQPHLDTPELDAALGVTEGGVVWLVKRPRRPEVCLQSLQLVFKLISVLEKGWLDQPGSSATGTLRSRPTQGRPSP